MSEFFERIVYAMLEAESDLDPMSARTVLIAALKAMREPTESMISRGSDESRLGGTLIGDGRLVMIWQAMIDQAIKEGGG